MNPPPPPFLGSPEKRHLISQRAIAYYQPGNQNSSNMCQESDHKDPNEYDQGFRNHQEYKPVIGPYKKRKKTTRKSPPLPPPSFYKKSVYHNHHHHNNDKKKKKKAQSVENV